MAWMSHNYNGDGVQANEYSTLAGGLDIVILRTSATNSNVLEGGEFTRTVKHILQLVTNKTTLVKLKNDVTRYVHNVHFIVSVSKAGLLYGKPDSRRIPSTVRFVCEIREAEFHETNGTYLNPRRMHAFSAISLS
jgi:hypothetical protein